jgi:hypothetical protein
MGERGEYALMVRLQIDSATGESPAALLARVEELFVEALPR